MPQIYCRTQYTMDAIAIDIYMIVATSKYQSLHHFRVIEAELSKTKQNVKSCNDANTNPYTAIPIMEQISIWFTFGWDFIIVHWKNRKRVWRNIRPTSHMDRWFWWRIWNLLLHQWVAVSANLLFKECVIGTHTHIVVLSNQISVMCGNYCNNWYSRMHRNIYLNGVQSGKYLETFLSLLFLDELWSSFFLLALSFFCRFNKFPQIISEI